MLKNILLVAALGSLVLPACSKRMNTSAPSENLKIVYNTLENKEKDDYDLYAMNADGSAPANITRHPDVAWTYYAWKNKLYFISDRDTCKRCYFLYESDAEGGQVRKVSGLRLEDSWMSSRNEGKEMIVSGRIGKETRFQFFLIDLKTGAFRQITSDTSAYYSDPCFSPDGRQIVYRYRKNRRDRNEKAELWLMNADGAATPRQLTHYPPSDTTAPWHSYHAGPPHWNEKAGFITYQSLQAGKYSIYAVTPDGKRNFKLLDMPLEAGWHAWSPDGEWLVMDASNHEQTSFDIWLWNHRTKRLKQLTASDRSEMAPVFVVKR